MGIDVHAILYQDYETEIKEQSSKMTSDNSEDKSKQVAIKNLVADEQNDNREDALMHLEKLRCEHSDGQEYDEPECKIDAPEHQRFLMLRLSNSLNIKNAQKIIILSNRENMRKGLTKEVSTGNKNLVRTGGKNQISTIAIPTQLLRYVQQEIGALSTRVTQNDILTGFLYWYFGKPEDVQFSDEDSVTKVEEIVENLDLNGSPAKLNRLNYNVSTALLDKLDMLMAQLDLISSLMTNASRESLDAKTRSEKMYIALCYNILNMLAFTPPVMPGEQPGDIDLLAGGSVWDLMSGIDMAYDYFKTKNGREIYKSKTHKKVQTFNYTQTVVSNDPVTQTTHTESVSQYDYNNDNDKDNDNDNDNDNDQDRVNYYDYYDDNEDYGDDDYEYSELDDYDSKFTNMFITKDTCGGEYAVDGDKTLDDIRNERDYNKRIGALIKPRIIEDPNKKTENN